MPQVGCVNDNHRNMLYPIEKISKASWWLGCFLCNTGVIYLGTPQDIDMGQLIILKKTGIPSSFLLFFQIIFLVVYQSKFLDPISPFQNHILSFLGTFTGEATAAFKICNFRTSLWNPSHRLYINERTAIRRLFVFIALKAMGGVILVSNTEISVIPQTGK